MNGEADHIHILFEADPFTAPGTLVNVIKTKTSRYARKQYGDTFLKESCQDSLFWSNSYFYYNCKRKQFAADTRVR